MKLLHSADWHLDTPFTGFSAQQQQTLRSALLQIPGKVASICQAEECELVLLSGDLFDGPYTKDSYQAAYQALEEMAVPVFVSPGNHDYICTESPWVRELWPENVFIFKEPHIVSVALTQPKCWIFGAGYASMDAPPMLEGFRAEDPHIPLIGILHADPTQASSPYCPVTKNQVANCGLDYLALGHIHKQGAFQGGKTLCAWPGCPMGRGYDEQGEKGVLIVTLEQTTHTRFISLDVPKFFDLAVSADESPAAAVEAVVPSIACDDYYRVTITGPSSPIDTQVLADRFSHLPNLVLRDRTTPPIDLWACAGEDSFEGVYFSLLKKELEHADSQYAQIVQLAAEISRQLLDGQEVHLL